MDYIFLILGFCILVVSGEFLVKASVSLASKFKVSKLVIGITVVSFGTSAPELFVSIDAALRSSPDIAMGNVVGSNISNIALVLGFTALLIAIPVCKNTIKFDWPFMMIVSLLLLLTGYDGSILWWEGIIFLILLFSYLTYNIRKSRKEIKSQEKTESDEKQYSLLISLVFILFSILGLYYGANILVSGAKNIAVEFGVSERVIGLTIIAFGTSVPELATSAVAAYKKQMDISVGNIIGSNIFNILAVLGITSIIKKINISKEILAIDINVMLAVSFLLFLLLIPLKKPVLTRYKAIVLLTCYCGYVFYLFNK